MHTLSILYRINAEIMALEMSPATDYDTVIKIEPAGEIIRECIKFEEEKNKRLEAECSAIKN
jgi:hypothetical protein